MDPTDFNPQFEATGCFLKVDKEFLLLLRQDNKPQGNVWGLPSGKMNLGETPLEGVIREVLEETGIVLNDSMPRYLGDFRVRYLDFDFRYHLFQHNLPSKPSIKINPIEHKDSRWVSPKEALSLTLIPSLYHYVNLFCKE